MSEQIYTYFVSYSHQEGFGNTVIQRGEPITNYAQIRTIQRGLHGAPDAIVLSWQLLSQETDPEPSTPSPY